MLILFFVSLFNLHAYLDLNYGTQARSYPMLGGEVFAESGYNYSVWGEKKDKNPFYGFVRPNVKAASSAVINSALAEFEIYPISFIGFSAGREFTRSDFNFPFFDCEEIECKGNITRNFVQGKMALGAKGIIATGQYKIEHVDHNKDGRPFGDFRKAMRADNGGDIQHERRFVVGYKNPESDYLVGAMWEESRYLESSQRNHMTVGILQKFMDGQSMLFGIGKFESTEVGLGNILLFRLQIDKIKSMRLF